MDAQAARAPGHVYPRAALRRAHDPVAAAGDLSAFEIELARAHWSGIDREELSRRFSRSRFTVDRHIATIYNAFSVDSQCALREEALRRGLA